MASFLQIFHLWWLPVLSAAIWWGMLITLMSIWASEGFPRYYAETKPTQYILYISDIAAGKYQYIFVCGSAMQGILFVLSGASELFLRLTGRLRRHFYTWTLWCTYISLLFSLVGQLGIFFVAIFDARRYPDTHVNMLVVYIVFVGISALFNVGAYYGLGQTHMTRRVQIGLWMKATWFTIECVLAVAFVTSQTRFVNVPAVLEWVISFVYPFYQLAIAYDIWPAIGKKHGHYPKRVASTRTTLCFGTPNGCLDSPSTNCISFEELCECTECGVSAGDTTDYEATPEKLFEVPLTPVDIIYTSSNATAELEKAAEMAAIAAARSAAVAVSAGAKYSAAAAAAAAAAATTDDELSSPRAHGGGGQRPPPPTPEKSI